MSYIAYVLGTALITLYLLKKGELLMSNTPMNSSPTATFRDFGLAPEIQQTLQACGFERPTEIQEKAIPLLLGSQSINFHGQAQTGTGKTLAFGIPLFHRINRSERRVQALVVVPTRELAVQICDSFKPLASALGLSLEAIYGGSSMELQLQKLRRGVHIVVGTPGRILDHLQRGSLNTDNVRTLVLDEADIMLDMGFKDDIDLILDELPESREIWLFSATVKSGIHTILKNHMKNHASVRVNSGEVATTKTKHYFCIATPQTRLAALCRFIECNPDFYGFIFCQTKVLASQIAEQLLVRGYKVGALHGDLSQSQRNVILKQFRAKERTIVVATDVAARGIDVSDLTHVVNYSFPDDWESYVHRSGRTGRAGKEGIAITFINKHEMRFVREMQRKFNIEMEPINVPSKEVMVNVRVNTINSYLAALSEQPLNDACTTIVNALDNDVCRNTLSHVLYDMFIKQIDTQEQYNHSTQDTEHHKGNHSSNSNQRITEMSINVGSDDGIEKQDILELLEHKNIPLDSILKVRVLKRCTFIHTQPEHLQNNIDALQGAVVGQRTIRATQVHDNGGGGGDRSHERGGRHNGRNRREYGGPKRFHNGDGPKDFPKRNGRFPYKNTTRKRDHHGFGGKKPDLYQADSSKKHEHML